MKKEKNLKLFWNIVKLVRNEYCSHLVISKIEYSPKFKIIDGCSCKGWYGRTEIYLTSNRSHLHTRRTINNLQTFLHELGHALVEQKFPNSKVKEHGRLWKKVMQDIYSIVNKHLEVKIK